MEDVWALGDLARELKRRERALGGLVRALKIRGGQALGGLVRALKIRGAGAWRVGSGVEDQGGRRLLPDLGY